MFRKPLLIATLAAAVGSAALSTDAAAGDPVLGALIGGGIGAAIGHDINRHNGGVVGGVLGAIVGANIAAESGPYYGNGYYEPAPRYYAPPVYAAPVYYASPAYGYRAAPRPYYRHYDRVVYNSRWDHRRDWR
jgi:hypothetical protein